MSKLLVAAALSGGALMAGIGTAEAATTASVPGTVKTFTTAYSSPTNQSSGMYTLYEGMQVDTYCIRDGQYLEGNPSWLIVNSDGVSAYVHAYDIHTEVNVPKCLN